jgi:hypothetical protein
MREFVGRKVTDPSMEETVNSVLQANGINGVGDLQNVPSMLPKVAAECGLTGAA